MVTVTPTPKLRRVCCSLMAVALYSFSEWLPAMRLPRFKRLTGGNTYSFFGASSFALISCCTLASSGSFAAAFSAFFDSSFFFKASVSVSMILPPAVTTRLASSGMEKSSA